MRQTRPSIARFKGQLASFVGAVVTVALMGGCSSGNKKKDEAALRMRIGTAHLAQGNHPSALRELLVAENLDPDNELIQNNLGLAYFLRDKFDLSAKHLRRALEIKPSYSEARNNYGRVLIELGRYDEAARELSRVVADLTYDDPAKALVNFGLVYFRKGDFRSAKGKFLEAMKANRDNCLAQTFYGRSLLELQEFQNAATALDNAVVVCRPVSFDEPFYFSGLSYYKLGQTSSAIARMEEVLKISPGGRYAKKAESLLKLMK